MKHLKKFNEGLIGRSDPDFEPSKDGSERKQEVYDAICDMVKNEKYGKDNSDNLSAWLEDISDDSFEILYNLLAGSGKIENND